MLSNSGHVQALVNPPGNPRATYHTCKGPHSSPEEFMEHAESQTGSWWEHWALWLAERSGDKVDAPKALGNDQYRPLCEAPGTYVR